MSRVLESTDYVVRRARHVAIDDTAVRKFCSSFDFGRLSHWLDKSPYDIRQISPSQRIPFVFVLNSISFCYWGFPKWRICYHGNRLDGTWALIACLGMAVQHGVPICEPDYLSKMSDRDFHMITKGNTAIPLASSRVAILNEVGREINNRHGGLFSNLVEMASYNAFAVVETLYKEMPSFYDVQEYHGQTIVFLKRAQLLASDLHYILNLDGVQSKRSIEGLSGLTACADYKLPQVLRRWDVLQYKNDLAERVDDCKEIARDSEEEVEIRACTIWAVEKIRICLSTARPGITASEISDYLWLLGQESVAAGKPYHLTLTTAY